ncbi:MAG: YitT family protein [Clostridia bacterium]
MKKKLKLPPLTLDILYTLIGCVVMGAGMNIFTIPNNIAPGGLSGLSTAIHQLIPEVPIGIITFGFNIIVLIFALKMFGFKSMWRVIFSSVTYAAAIDLLSFLPGYTDDLLLSAVLGGAMIGLGLGLLFMRNMSTAGTDMITLMLKKKFPSLQRGTIMICVDAAVVLIAVIIFKDIKVALYSGVTIFCCGKVVDAIMHGIDYAKVLLIITDKPSEIEHLICNELGRGVTELPAKGGFTKENKTILMTVARRREVYETLHMIRKIDNRAFIVLHNATEVHGEGFKEEQL